MIDQTDTDSIAIYSACMENDRYESRKRCQNHAEDMGPPC